MQMSGACLFTRRDKDDNDNDDHYREPSNCAEQMRNERTRGLFIRSLPVCRCVRVCVITIIVNRLCERAR